MLEEKVTLPHGQKIYFASDFHLGVPDPSTTFLREKRIIEWLESIKKDAHSLYLLGDIFDFWFEYKHAIPKGFIRLQGKLAELRDAGLPIFFFTGNHDTWMFDYFEKELGIKIYRQPIVLVTSTHKIMLGHGDGLGPGDSSYKFLKKVFTSSFCQWLFARIHPNLGIRLAQRWSRKSRISNMKLKEKFDGEEKEYLFAYCKEIESNTHHDYYIFGHRHLALDLSVGSSSRYINTGEWVHESPFAEYDGERVSLKQFK